MSESLADLADPGICKRALGVEIEAIEDDVEAVRNPKNWLKRAVLNYNEVEHGGKILDHLSIRSVLAHPGHCGWLRSCVAWMVQALKEGLDPSQHAALDDLADSCQLQSGRCEPLTLHQGAEEP